MKYYLSSILCCFVVLSACEKENGMTDKDQDFFKVDIYSAVIGTWNRTEKIPSGLSKADFKYFDIEWIYKFNADATYSNLVNFYGFDDENPDEIIGQSKTTGTYEIRKDSIFMKGITLTSWEKGFNPEPDATTLNGDSYGSRFDITDNTLTLFYISYPADAPVQTQMNYQRTE